MVGFLNFLVAVMPLLYGLAAVNYLVYFLRDDPFAERTCSGCLGAAVAVHVLFTALWSIHYGHHPVSSLPEALSIIGLSVACVYLYVEQIQKQRTTGAFIVPVVVLFQLAASALLPQAPTAEAASIYAGNPLFGFHIVMAVFGYSAFALSAVYGIMFLVMYRALKSGRFGLMFERLPSLDVLSGMAFGATILGWGMLTVAIVLGAVMSLEHLPGFYTDPKFISTLAVWLVYATAVGTYFGLNWRGARAVYLSLTGFVFAVVATVGSTFVWSTFHAFLS